MKTVDEAIELDRLQRVNRQGPDDLFICCASFEERCISSILKMGADFQTRFAVIFVIDDPQNRRQVETNSFKLQAALRDRASQGIFVINCEREDPIQGVGELGRIWQQCSPWISNEPYVSLDISGFTKIYLLELLHYLMISLKLQVPRILHTTQAYLPGKLTDGTTQITTIPSFFGSFSLDKKIALILFLGFEPDRTLSIWKHFNPAKTLAIITNPPRDGYLNYVKYARDNNATLLSQPSVELREAPADNPYAVKNVLETIRKELSGAYNLVIGPFGTKSQTVGVFLFWLDHRKTQIVYSFPGKYTDSYLKRRPGTTLILPTGTSVAVQISRP
jgi:hypothetical protein